MTSVMHIDAATVNRRPARIHDHPPALPEWAKDLLDFEVTSTEQGMGIDVVPAMESVTPAQAARSLSVSRSTVSRWIKTGKLKSVKVGNRHRIPKQDLDAFDRQLFQARARTLAELDELQEADQAR